LTVDNIDVEATIKKVQQLLAEEAHLSSALRAALEVLIVLVQLLANRLSLNSRNSSKPPSTDRFNKGNKDNNNDGDNQKQGKNNKPGGQPGRLGTTLQKVDDPDEIKILALDRTTLPPGEYKEDGFESRQVVDIDSRRVVTEYRAEVLEACPEPVEGINPATALPRLFQRRELMPCHTVTALKLRRCICLNIN
jgi:transposase